MQIARIPCVFRHFLVAACCVLLAACQTPAGLSQAQISLLKDSGFSETDAGWELNLDALLLFDIDSAVLNQKERDSLTKIAHTLKVIGVKDIVIEGHADNTGTASYNRELSRQRAERVAHYLAESGLPREWMSVHAMGSDVPIASNATRAGRRENRRTVIIIPSH